MSDNHRALSCHTSSLGTMLSRRYQCLGNGNNAGFEWSWYHSIAL